MTIIFRDNVLSSSAALKLGSNFLPVLENQNQEFWEAVTLGDLERVTIEGNHISCMQEPLVKNIAEFILNCGR